MKKAVGFLAVTLVLALLVLILVSWLMSATMGGDIRSMLSAEGIRFFMGGFTRMLLHPLLAWLLLSAMAWGCLRQSGLAEVFSHGEQKHRQHRHLLLLLSIAALYTGFVLLLTCTPHAVLLSATGRLWPSPFSSALVPLVAFGVVLLSVAFGLLERRFLSVADIFGALSSGISQWAPVLMLYVLAMQLVESFRFVFFGV